MRKLIPRLIEEDAALQVIGTARNGLEAVGMVQDLKPDVVTLDIEMPVMDGLEALDKIMEKRPTPVIMLSSLTQEGADATIAALQSGAVDFVSKPSGSISTDLFKVKDELVSKIKQAARMPLRSFILNGKFAPRSRTEQPTSAKTGLTKRFDQIVAIGTSTGGPKALETVITALPASFPFPIVLVQHMPPKFTKSLAERLNRLSNVRVIEAEDNQPVLGGTVYIAPGDYHLNVVQTHREFKIHLHRQPARNGHRPSVDELFESVSRLKSLDKHYILMTGMGSDGAQGMQAAKLAGARSTVAESQETCIVYGMPKAAVALNCVDYTVPLHRIASKIVEITGLS
jgi:two-component system chemotaxis response regulator CheB